MRNISPMIRGLGMLLTLQGFALLIVAGAMAGVGGMNRLSVALLTFGGACAVAGVVAVYLIDRSVSAREKRFFK
jgi:hypothetical protein